MYLALLHCQLSTQRYQRNSYSLSTQYIGIGGGAGVGGGGGREGGIPPNKNLGERSPPRRFGAENSELTQQDGRGKKMANLV